MKIIKRNLHINSKHYLYVIELLINAGAKARVVGGAVRDAIRGRPYADIDIATDLTPDKMILLFEKNKIRVVPTGIKFGTVTVFIEDEHFEITTLRRDISCDGRHANVEYTDDFKEDAARRDFTINALSYCPIEHIIYDYFEGVEDIENRRVVFIGDATERIREDYLRILRFFRFSCRYAKELNKANLEACVLERHNLKKLSKERVKSELDLLLSLEKAEDIFDSMYRCGIASEILDITNYNKQMHISAIEIAKNLNIVLHLPVIYAIIFTDDDEISQNKLLSLKFSRVESRQVMQCLEFRKILDINTMIIKLKNLWLDDKNYFLYFLYASLLNDNKKLVLELYDKLKNAEIPVFPVSGNDLLELGYSGSKLGSVFNNLKQEWINSDFAINRDKLINLIKK